MITVSKNSTMPDGSTAAYSKDELTIGDIVSVSWHDREGTAIVVKDTPVVGGQIHLVRLDVDWSSFDRSNDE